MRVPCFRLWARRSCKQSLIDNLPRPPPFPLRHEIHKKVRGPITLHEFIPFNQSGLFSTWIIVCDYCQFREIKEYREINAKVSLFAIHWICEHKLYEIRNNVILLKSNLILLTQKFLYLNKIVLFYCLTFCMNIYYSF